MANEGCITRRILRPAGQRGLREGFRVRMGHRGHHGLHRGDYGLHGLLHRWHFLLLERMDVLWMLRWNGLWIWVVLQNGLQIGLIGLIGLHFLSLALNSDSYLRTWFFALKTKQI